MRRVKSSSASASSSNSAARRAVTSARPLCFTAAVVAALALACAGSHAAAQSPHAPAPAKQSCTDPENIDSALSSTSSSLQQGAYAAAIEILQPLATSACDPRITLLLAAALEGSGDREKAAQALIQGHTLYPANNSISASLARAYLTRGDTASAAAALDTFHPGPTTPPQEMQEAIIVFLAAHRLPQAQKVAEAAYKTYPSLDSLLLLANVLQSQGRFKEVNLMLNAKRGAYSGSPKFLITLAESEFDAMIYDAARTDLEHAVALDSASYQAHFLLGNVLVKLADPDRAEKEYRTAIELSPRQPRTYYQLAIVLRDKQDEPGQEQMLRQALIADDRYAPAHCELGKLLVAQNHLPEAVAELNLSIQSNPQYEQAYFLLAKAYSTLGDKEKSAVMAKKFTEVRTENRRGTEDKFQPGDNHEVSP
jgi:tetratricopeptide (TPR) repeat protein